MNILKSNSFTYIIIFYLFTYLFYILFISLFKKLNLIDPVTLKDSEKLAQLHSKKKNIPTMGGVIFLLPIYFLLKENLYAEVILITSFFILGLVDDLLKIGKKNFSIRYRLWLEFFSVFFYLLYKIKVGELIPVFYLGSQKIYLSYFLYTLITSFIFVGIINSFNITDGVDGLLGSLAIQIITATLIIFSKFDISFIPILNLLNALLGCLLGFLIFNFYPAKVFMGNTGSLTLGAILATIYTLYNFQLLLLGVSFVLVFNTISVMIQSFSFRIFGKRVFPIAPFHHTLEFKNFTTIQIVLLYFLVNLLIIILVVIFL